jgi:hypothetical protein
MLIGEWPDYEEYVYFIRHGCEDDLIPENCIEGEPLTWERNQHATYVYRLNATYVWCESLFAQ